MMTDSEFFHEREDIKIVGKKILILELIPQGR